MIVNKDLPYKTLKDLVADAKANPDKLIYSSSGLYGASHIPTVLFAKSAGDLHFRHLPTNGGGPAVPAGLRGGGKFFFFSPAAPIAPHPPPETKAGPRCWAPPPPTAPPPRHS